MVVAPPGACGPQTNESHWGSIASPAPPMPASSPGHRRIALDPLLLSCDAARVAAQRGRRVRHLRHDRPAGCAVNTNRRVIKVGHKRRTPDTAAAQLATRSTSSERKKTKGRSLHRGKTKKPTAHKQVRYRQPCCRGRSARAAGTRTHPASPPAGPNATEKDADPPRQTSSSSSTAACPEGQPPLPSTGAAR
jgi:hypothetical protein